MKQSKKLLCMLLVVIMMFSTVSIGVSAQRYDYSKPASYNAHGDPVLSAAQRATMLFDSIDASLAEKNEVLDYTFAGVGVYIDMRSIDALLDTIDKTLNSTEFDLVKGFLGDAKNINDAHLNDCRRSTPGIDEVNLLVMVLNFANDNISLIKDYIRGKLDLGSLVSLDPPNLSATLHDSLYSSLVDETATAAPAGVTADQMLQHVVDVKLLGGTDHNGDVEEGLLPSMAGKTDISTITLYQFLENALNAAMTDYVMPIINTDLKRELKELAGYTFADENDMVGDDSNVNEFLKENINFDYNFEGYVWGDTPEGAFGQINDLFDYIFSLIWKGEDFWVGGSNKNFLTNVRNLALVLYKSFGDQFLPDSFEPKPIEELEAMGVEELVVYIATSFVEKELDYVIIETECKTLEELACYALMALSAEIIPVQNYMAKVANGQIEFGEPLFYQILSDLAVYYLSAVIPVKPAELPYGVSFEATLMNALKWALKVENFGGFFSTCNTSSSNPWVVIDNTIGRILPFSIFGGNIQGSEDLFKNHFVKAILDLDLDALLSLLYKNNDASAPLNKTALQFVIWLVNNILGVVCGGATIIPSSVTTVETLISDENIATLAENLIRGLLAQGSDIFRSALPLITGSMEDDLPFMGVQVPAGYGTRTIDQLRDGVAALDAVTGYAEDIYDTDVTHWNARPDFELWTWTKYNNALRESRSFVEDYDAAVAAGADVSAFTPEEITKSYYKLENLYVNVLSQREACTTQLDYVIEMANNAGYKKSNYSKEVWAYYDKALKHANTVTNIDIYIEDDYGDEQWYLKQSMVNLARRELITAMRLLDNPTASYEELDALIEEAEAIDTSIYTPASVEAFNIALTEAKELSRLLALDDQDKVDEATANLQKAIDNLEAAQVDTEITAVADGVEVNRENGYIYGIDAFLTTADIEAYIGTTNGGEIVITTVDGGDSIGTGAKVELVNNGEVVESFDVVVFGDATGDGAIDESDWAIMDAYMGWLYDIEYGTPAFFASDLDADELVMETDMMIIDNVCAWVGEINQQDPYNFVVY